MTNGNALEVAVVGDPELLRFLQARGGDYLFIDGESGDRESGGATIAVVSGGDAAAAALSRIVLDPSAKAEGRRRGDLLVSRDSFVAAPESFLAICRDLVEVEEEARHVREELEFLEHVQELTTLADSGAVSAKIMRAVLDILRLPVGTLMLHDPKIERYVVSYSNDSANRDTGEFVPGIPTRILQKALNSPRAYAFDPPSAGVPGMLVMPIEVQEDMIGVLKIPVPAGDRFEESAAERAAHYLGIVTSVLGNIYQLTRSKDLAMRDDLTKAYNRRFFESYLDEEIERARRYGSVLSIIFLDLDDLKIVNNLYGHLTGSRTLQEVAKRMLGAVRGIDKVVRFGGDEFCIILPQTDEEQARAVAARVRKAISGEPFRLEADVEVSITASFGIATYPQHAVTKEELIRRADAAMYNVKATTKNAIGIASNDVPARARKGEPV